MSRPRETANLAALLDDRPELADLMLGPLVELGVSAA